MIIFIDTNVLLALVRSVDPMHPIAVRDLDRLRKNELVVTTAVLVESVHFMRRADQRARLRDYTAMFNIGCSPCDDTPTIRHDVFIWMGKYADHAPDYADAHLCVISQYVAKSKVWTYDSEFYHVWRRPDGSAVPMAVKR